MRPRARCSRDRNSSIARISPTGAMPSASALDRQVGRRHVARSRREHRVVERHRRAVADAGPHVVEVEPLGRPGIQHQLLDLAPRARHSRRRGGRAANPARRHRRARPRPPARPRSPCAVPGPPRDSRRSRRRSPGLRPARPACRAGPARRPRAPPGCRPGARATCSTAPARAVRHVPHPHDPAAAQHRDRARLLRQPAMILAAEPRHPERIVACRPRPRRSAPRRASGPAPRPRHSSSTMRAGPGSRRNAATRRASSFTDGRLRRPTSSPDLIRRSPPAEANSLKPSLRAGEGRSPPASRSGRPARRTRAAAPPRLPGRRRNTAG